MKKKTKICASPNCQEPFEYKSSKKKFCNNYCKNQAAYQHIILVYPWDVAMFKARRKNIQIVEYLFEKGYCRILYHELIQMGFDPSAAYSPVQGEDGASYMRYGNIGLRIISKTECILVNLKKI